MAVGNSLASAGASLPHPSATPTSMPVVWLWLPATSWCIAWTAVSTQQAKISPTGSRPYLKAAPCGAVSILCILHYAGGGGGLICLIESTSLLMTCYVASRSLWTCRHPLLVFGWKYHPLLETGSHKNVSSASWLRWWWWRALFKDGEDTRGLAL